MIPSVAGAASLPAAGAPGAIPAAPAAASALPAAEVRRVLVLAQCGVGDLVMFLPTLRSLRSGLPGTTIDVVLSPNRTRELVEGSGLCDRIIELGHPRWFGRHRALGRWLQYVRMGAFYLGLARRRYDVVIWPQCGTTPLKELATWLVWPRWAVLHGRRAPRAAPWPLPRFLWIDDVNPRHRTELNRAVLDLLGLPLVEGGPVIQLRREELDWASDYLRRHGITGARPVVGLHPGGNLRWDTTRDWGVESFARLGDELASRWGTQLVLFGGADERARLVDIASRIRGACALAAGCEVTLRRTCALVAHCAVLVGNNSSLVQVAAALGVWSFGLLGPCHSDRSGPRGTRARSIRLDLPCSPCFESGFAKRCPHRACLSHLDPHGVAEAVHSLTGLGREPPRSPLPDGDLVLDSSEALRLMTPEFLAERSRSRWGAGRSG